MKVLVKMVHGSAMYGTATPGSDTDYKGVYLPNPGEVLAGVTFETIDESTGDSLSKNTKDDIDSQMYPFQKFLQMLCVGDMVALDMLHALPEHCVESSPEWEWLQENKQLFYTKNMAGLLGYVRKQAARYGIKGSRVAELEEVKKYLKVFPTTLRLSETDYRFKLRNMEHVEVLPNGWVTILGKKFQDTTKIRDVLVSVTSLLNGYGERAKLAAKNEGIDWKAVSHALRAAYQLEEMLTTGDLVYPLKDRAFLLQVKKGELDFRTSVQPELEAMVDVVTKLAEKSTYPLEVTTETLQKVSSAVYFKAMRR